MLQKQLKAAEKFCVRSVFCELTGTSSSTTSLTLSSMESIPTPYNTGSTITCYFTTTGNILGQIKTRYKLGDEYIRTCVLLIL